MRNKIETFGMILAAVSMALAGCQQTAKVEWPAPTVDEWVALSDKSPSRVEVMQTFEKIEANWHPGYRTVLAEFLGFRLDDLVQQQIAELLRKHADVYDVSAIDSIRKKIWNEPYDPAPEYADFKAEFYARLDPRFKKYFSSSYDATIRLDEIFWGGVKQDGIPPLDQPEVVDADAPEAEYLADSNVVFGVQVNGQPRCYPKRILAWHEMVKDTVGGVSINGVY